jgi:hypothetical protein
MQKIGWRSSILFILCTLMGPPAGAGVSQGDIASWQEELAAIDGALRAGEWRSAESAAEALLEEITEADPGPELTNLVSVVVLSRALAEAGEGDTEDAVWHWYAAQNLNPRLRRARFPAYGAAGELLERHRLREAGAPPAGLSPHPSGPRAEPPKPESSDEIPETWARFEVVVAEDGSVHAPVLVAPGPPAATLETLEALRDLELEPARADGEAVAFYWRPRPEVWVIHDTGLPAGEGTEVRGAPNQELEDSLAACTSLGSVIESSGASNTWPGSPFLGPAPGMVETLKSKAARQGADTLVLDNYDDHGVKGSAYECGASWYPPHLASTNP